MYVTVTVQLPSNLPTRSVFLTEVVVTYYSAFTLTMTLSKISQTKDNLLKVLSYSIDQTQLLGRGAFGVVFKGTDAKKNTIAAKKNQLN